MYEKLKSWLADEAVFTALLLVMVGIVSFGLGRQSMIEDSQNKAPLQPAGVIFTKTDTTQPGITTSIEAKAEVVGVQVIGSRSGTKYHLPSCPGVKQMKEENKIYFDSVPVAKAAGYTPAANCPGI